MTMPERRKCLLGLSALAAWAATARTAGAAPAARAPGASPVAVEVWKSPSCGCCTQWVEHLRAEGFAVTVHDSGNTAMRARLGMPERLGSCHTARVGGYAIEGHVPAREIRRLLAERPKAVGLTVPGMPSGSPGMEQGDHRDPYDVLLVSADGKTRVFQPYR